MLRKSLIAAMCLALAALLCGPASAEETITLKYSNFFPSSHVHSKLAEAWCQEITKRTGGKVQFQYHPGGTLTKANRAYDGVLRGRSDLAMSCFAYTRGRFPVLEVVDLPLGYGNAVEATTVANDVVRELHPQELDGVEVMYLHAHGPGLLHTQTRPVEKLEDVKGMKIRCTGTTVALAQALGAAPTTMTMPDTYLALARGGLDGAFFPIESGQGWKLAEVVKYCTENYSTAYTTTFFVVMNKQVWDSLPADVQKVIQEVNTEWIAKTAAAWDQADEDGRKFFLSKEGRKFIKLSDEEQARWSTAVEPVLAEFVTRSNEKGLDGKKILDTAQASLKKAQGK